MLLSSKCFLCGLETGWVYWKERGAFCIIAYWLWSAACSLWFPLGLPLPDENIAQCAIARRFEEQNGSKRRRPLSLARPQHVTFAPSAEFQYSTQYNAVRTSRSVDLHACLTNQRASPLPLNGQNEFPLLLFVCLQNTLAYIIGFGLGKHCRRNVRAAHVKMGCKRKRGIA